MSNVHPMNTGYAVYYVFDGMNTETLLKEWHSIMEQINDAEENLHTLELDEGRITSTADSSMYQKRMERAKRDLSALQTAKEMLFKEIDSRMADEFKTKQGG